MSRTALIRIRFPLEVVDYLDGLAEQMRVESRLRVSRAALIRALVRLNLSDAMVDHHQLAGEIGVDPVKRGKKKSPNPKRRRTRRRVTTG